MSSYIDSLNQTSNSAGASSTSSSSTSAISDATMGKEDFLMLLVAQLQNQDPLNPDEPTEFTAQLAQFSSLEQLFTLNDSMQSLTSTTANANQMSALSSIGKEATYFSSKFDYSGEPIDVGYQLDGNASEVTISLQRGGVTVATLEGTELSSGNHYITWDGTTDSGATAEQGSYTIVISAKAASGESVAVSPLVKAEVTGVDLNGANGTTLITKAGEVALTDVLGIFDKSESAQSGNQNTTEQESSSNLLGDAAETTGTAADIANNVEEIIE